SRSGNNLKISSGNRHRNKILSILSGEFTGARDLLRATIVIDCRKVADTLRHTRAKIQNIERSNDTGKRKAREIKVEPKSSQVERLFCVGNISTHVWQETAAGRSRLPANLLKCLIDSHGTEIVGKPAPHSVLQR